MQTKRLTRWTIGAVLATGALLLGACGGSGEDKAGGAEKEKPRVLTMANAIHGEPPAQLSSWAEEVGRLSGGTLAIEFKNGWRMGEARYEAGTLRDVRAGKADLAWVGARAFDTVGLTSFQALVAPLLIDSYELEAKVFEQGIPEQMLEGVEELDLVGIGVLPGPMRKLLGVSKAFVRPGDFAGEVVGLQDSAVADKTLRALGATPRPVPSSAKLDGLDAYEQQLSSIEGNGYDRGAKYVTANVNLWPRPLVLVMRKQAFDTLNDEQQSALRDAATAAIAGALDASRAEDADAAPVLCRRGLKFASASASELAELRAAFAPVYAALEADPETKSAIDEISDLKAELAAPAEAPVCAPDKHASSASPIPDGTYQTSLTKADWLAAGISEKEASRWTTGVHTMIFDAGQLTILDPSGEPGFRASYTVFRDQITAEDASDKITARWSLEGDTLRFTDLRGGGFPFVVTWESHPWVRVSAQRKPIDGVYEFTTTEQELLAAGAEEAPLENYGAFRWVLDGGRFEMTQKNGASDRWAKGTYVVRGDVVEFTVEDNGGVAPNDAHERPGEVFTFRWSLYRDRLTLAAVEDAISPEPFRAKPWSRVK